MEYIKPKVVLLKNHAEIKEVWIQNVIAEDPSVLGLGELELRDRERLQPRAGRLDLLLQDPETKRRFEVEVQLGPTDETHIIRTLEYWDIERKRYPQYDHCAVIVAEEITSRFLNVISLFNGTIPLIALQMTAIEVGDKLSLIFTKVLDEMPRGLVDEDEDALATPVDRTYWEKRSTPAMLKLTDTMLEKLKTLEPDLELNFNKHYIGLFKAGQPFNFVAFRPRKSRVNLEIKLPKSEEIDAAIESSGIETLEYNTRWQHYRISLKPEDLSQNEETLMELLKRAYERRVS